MPTSFEQSPSRFNHSYLILLVFYLDVLKHSNIMCKRKFVQLKAFVLIFFILNTLKSQPPTLQFLKVIPTRKLFIHQIHNSVSDYLSQCYFVNDNNSDNDSDNDNDSDLWQLLKFKLWHLWRWHDRQTESANPCNVYLASESLFPGTASIEPSFVFPQKHACLTQ